MYDEHPFSISSFVAFVFSKQISRAYISRYIGLIVSSVDPSIVLISRFYFLLCVSFTVDIYIYIYDRTFNYNSFVVYVFIFKIACSSAAIGLNVANTHTVHICIICKYIFVFNTRTCSSTRAIYATKDDRVSSVNRTFVVKHAMYAIHNTHTLFLGFTELGLAVKAYLLVVMYYVHDGIRVTGLFCPNGVFSHSCEYVVLDLFSVNFQWTNSGHDRRRCYNI